MLSKTRRTKNRELLNSFHQRSCLVCGLIPSDPCHIKSKGAGGSDIESNIIPLCRVHHTEQHKIGLTTFCRKYDPVMRELERKGWVIEGFRIVYRNLDNLK